MNGTGNNNPQWISKPNLAGRITVGSEHGIRITGNLYYGEATGREQLAMVGGEIRLNYENYLRSSLPIHTDKLTVEFIARF